MIKRKYWLKKIELSWRERSILWLSGVRRSGKTVLSQTLPNIDYYDCELPRIRGLMADPEVFLKDRQGKRIVLDEIHCLDNPSELLKIAADHILRQKFLRPVLPQLVLQQNLKIHWLEGKQSYGLPQLFMMI